ncbi:MAG: hypothetical protein J7K26_03200 [Candidatus Aenigmarchaeota archaeon]|nr:hypothetical protein [Candidatus Aenigmarchaeota archaeon]
MEEKKIKVAKVSYNLTIMSTIMIFLGILLGSFIPYTVYLASIGSFLLLISIIIYIISELR